MCLHPNVKQHTDLRKSNLAPGGAYDLEVADGAAPTLLAARARQACTDAHLQEPWLLAGKGVADGQEVHLVGEGAHLQNGVLVRGQYLRA